MIFFKNYGSFECVAFTRHFFDELHRLIPESGDISYQNVFDEVKDLGSQKAGGVSQNVSYLLKNGAHEINRSIVIRYDVISL